MSAANLLLEHPGETSGPATSRRYDYQKSWALCLLLDLHCDAGDYAILFDHHDDVLVLDSAATPTAVDFYQIKTKAKGVWRVTGLLQRDSGASGPLSSILGKLYGHRVRFGAATRSLRIVSNAPLDAPVRLPPPSHERPVVSFTELTEKEIGAIAAKLRTELSLSEDPDCAGLLHFHLSSVPLLDAPTYVKGRLVCFLDLHYPRTSQQVVPIYRALADEITRRTDSTPTCSTLDDLLQHKGFSRTTFGGLLAAMSLDRDMDALWRHISVQLGMHGWSPLEVKRLKLGWVEYEARRTNPIDAVLRDARAVVAKVVASAHLPRVNVRATVRAACEQARALASSQDTLSEELMQALVLAELYE